MQNETALIYFKQREQVFHLIIHSFYIYSK